MKVTENPEEIIIRYIPIRKWVAGGILTFIFGVFCMWLIYLANNSSVNSGNWLFFLPLIVFVVAGVLIAVFEISLNSLIFAPLTILFVNRKTSSIDIIFRRFYGKKAERFYFHQIEKFKSYKARVNLSSQYFLALVLANQKVIKLNIPIGGDKQNTVKFIKKLNKFIRFKRLSEEQ